jgi:hypothetical protein
MITHDQINDLIDSGTLSEFNAETAKLLLQALNDWPTRVDDLEKYFLEVEDKIRGTITLPRVEESLANLDLSRDAWIGESLTSIKEILILNSGTELRQIVKRILE